MTLISPVCNLTQSTYQLTKENIALQLYAGCMAANIAFGGDMTAACKAKFPDGAALAPTQLR